ncbi:probable ATP-dependent RNA helicase DDX46 [Abrus precatorius]|uniref:Probable ATP-dependent RNA helicase DDX46 n=1 Tax=Abrus precatorius TaxID=3816 RepID=A0A8B8JLY1_ABRPR|nr:probable ATP-dependent RNA helicase DDX46 [Abrus precatorius]
MEEEKAAAYYDELTRKGEGAARFKQGLGFSASAPNDDVPKPGSALLTSSSSFLSKFVKASTPSNTSESEKQAQLQSIQNKLRKNPSSESRVSDKPNHGSSSSRRRSRSRSRSRERYREKESRRRSRSRDRYRHRDSDGDRDRDKRQRERERGRRRSRSVSPRKQRRSENDASDVRKRGKVSEMRKGKNAEVDYSKLIQGYQDMSSAERVKAKMKLQLSKTAAQDSEKGVGWERFEFNKDAPLDDDEEIEAAEDDASLVKHVGQSFRFSAVEARREEQIQAAHEEAMFGATTHPPPISTDSEPERENEEVDKKQVVTSLLSETVLAKQKGSWRDRVRQA